MKSAPSFPLRAWMIAPACACVFVIAIGIARVRHLDFLAEVGGPAAALSHESYTGYAGGVRQFIPGSRDSVSLEPIIQTQQMIADGALRVRHVDYDNAPAGREVLSTSPHLWWLGAIAAVHGLFSGLPGGAAIERAALYADPLLQLILIAGTAVFVSRRFGGAAAVLVSIGLALMVPLATVFAPGQPRVDGLAAGAALWSVLLVVAVIVDERKEAEARTGRTLFAAGIAGGIALWLDAGAGLPVVGGIALGAHAMSWLMRSAKPEEAAKALPWRIWAAGGAIACLAGYCVEFLPAQTAGMRLDVVNPLHGLAWLGAAELIVRADGWVRRTVAFRVKRDVLPVALAIAAITAPVVVAIRTRGELFGPDPSLLRLTPLSEGAIASGVWAWLSQEGFSALSLATIAPLALIALLVAQLSGRSRPARERALAALALGPVAVTLIVAAIHMRRWVVLDAVMLASTAVLARQAHAAAGAALRWAMLGAVCALALVPGLLVLWPKAAADSVSESELASLIERDLAQWLAQRAGEGRPVVIASPSLAASLAYHGGFRALGSPYRENRAGFDLSLRIAGTSSQDEAHALVTNRGVTHLVLASWDTSLEGFASLGSSEDKSLVAHLHQWVPPRWLRPVPYPVPQVPGVALPEVLVFEVVEVQDNSVALSVLAEYFVETGRGGLAASAAEALGRLFPEDLGAQVARARAANAVGLRDQTHDAFTAVMTLIDAPASANLAWERRVSLALLLAEAKRTDLARPQLERCVGELDEARLRSLSPASLRGFVALSGAAGLRPADRSLWDLAIRLASPDAPAGS